MKLSKLIPVLGVLLVLITSQPASATLVLLGPGSHYVTTKVEENIEIDDAALVTLITGAEVLPPTPTPLPDRGDDAVRVDGQSTLNVQNVHIKGSGGALFGGGGIDMVDGSTVNVYSGLIEGSSGPDQNRGGVGIDSFDSTLKTLNVFGGQIRGGDATTGTTNYAGDGIVADDVALYISGGNIYGGNVTGTSDAFTGEGIWITGNVGSTHIIGGNIYGGNGRYGGDAVGFWHGSNPATIDGGLLQGGDGTFGDGGDGLSLYGGRSLTINGGTFIGGNGSGTSYASGGDALNISGHIDNHVSISGGDFFPGTGVDSNGYALNNWYGAKVEIFDGNFYGDVNAGFATSFDIQGGYFEGDIFGYGDAFFDITGGSFIGDFLGYDDAIFDVYGTNLYFSGGLLTGFLLDGSSLNLNVELYDSAQLLLNGSLPTSAVPEPSTLLLFSTGLVGIGILGRKFKG